MTNRIAIAVAEWLLERQSVKAATPVTVADRSSDLSSSQIHRDQRATRSNSSSVGEMPPLHDKMRVCYRTDDSEETWHLARVVRRKRHCQGVGRGYPIGTAISSWLIIRHFTPGRQTKSESDRIAESRSRSRKSDRAISKSQGEAR